MAKKKSGRKAKPSESRRQPEAGLPSLPDWRTIEGAMHGAFGHAEAETPLEEAQQLMYSAFEADGDQRVALAREALEISPDCADAYVVLAESVATVGEAIELYGQGVAAGQRALGKEAFKEYRGHFWGVLETRPYMRARLGLAQALWDAGRRDEAVEHYQEMLRLNPGDNQGVRYLLATALLELNREEELDRLLGAYPDDCTANWKYARALLAFRREGDSHSARRQLLAAQKVNPHVPDYLVGRAPLPSQMPNYVRYGGEDEAAVYAAEALTAWRETPGAIGWVRKVFHLSIAAEREPRRPPWSQVRARLLRLPLVEGEVWQVDARPAPVDPQGEETQVRPWILLVTNPTEDVVLQLEVGESRPSASDVWDYLVMSMLNPRHDDPHRPAKVEVRMKSLFNAWQSKLEEIQVACEVHKRLDYVEEVLERLPPRREVEGEPADLADLPQEIGEVWQADVQRMPTWLEEDGEPKRPWVGIVVNRNDDLILAHEVMTERPTAERLWECLALALGRPAVGEPHRPETVEVRPEHAAFLEACLEPLGIRCIVFERLEWMERVVKNLGEHMADGPLTLGLLDVPGMPVEQAGGFFEAAAAFYRRAPWRDTRWDAVTRIECDKFESGPWYALVMGQSGMVLGISLYEDLDIVRGMIAGGRSSEESFRRMSALSVLFGEAFEMPFADLDALETYDWPIAAPEAYPHAQRVNPGYAVRPPLPWELELLEATLRAVPDFLGQSLAEQTVSIATGTGQLLLRLSKLDRPV